MRPGIGTRRRTAAETHGYPLTPPNIARRRVIYRRLSAAPNVRSRRSGAGRLDGGTPSIGSSALVCFSGLLAGSRRGPDPPMTSS